MMKKDEVLYLSYTGMMEPLGESQVLSYLFGLSNFYNFTIISFERKVDIENNNKVNQFKNKLSSHNIDWLFFEYKFGGKYYFQNLYKMYSESKKIVQLNNIKLIHARGYLPYVVSYLLKRKLNTFKNIFDTRGFWFDEKVDVGEWKKSGFFYKFSKTLESKLYLNADAVVMLSKKSISLIKSNKVFKNGNNITNIHYIPTCTDLNKFSFSKSTNNSKPFIGYVGNAVGWYDFDKTAKILVQISKFLDFNLVIYNADQHQLISKKLLEHGFNKEYNLKKVNHSEIAKEIAKMDISIFFIKPLFSKNASAATKLGELMSCGVPVITNSNVGDHEELINSYNTGIIVDIDEEIELEHLQNKVKYLLSNEVRQNCRKLAEDVFSLEKGIEKYLEIYTSLL
ncbi:glycosyltransferase involved in cell wall biosynthesis [Flavobacterium croceum DSM 17960]|uniref:Glycosyltransferase involved in cell wall biosynthesis n=1 Tax=Flavobacterium croceum DSM 17960 TaxID=1121886 RepID=A0A2S4N9J0_9FLAO|nr:glycosyltransferase [Flavobacterium croceum]POS02357.1 glycosyltransferase involved in cell wall biosynthesis [Flavobacterium croceum DSM 17960]